jgi:hypothetical protein
MSEPWLTARTRLRTRDWTGDPEGRGTRALARTAYSDPTPRSAARRTLATLASGLASSGVALAGWPSRGRGGVPLVTLGSGGAGRAFSGAVRPGEKLDGSAGSRGWGGRAGGWAGWGGLSSAASLSGGPGPAPPGRPPALSALLPVRSSPPSRCCARDGRPGPAAVSLRHRDQPGTG